MAEEKKILVLVGRQEGAASANEPAARARGQGSLTPHRPPANGVAMGSLVGLHSAQDEDRHWASYGSEAPRMELAGHGEAVRTGTCSRDK